MANKKHNLQELLRTISDLMAPKDHFFFLKTLTTDGMQQHYDKAPTCFVKHSKFLFPICNEMGTVCPKMIAFSLSYAKRLEDEEMIAPENVWKIIDKLQKLGIKYTPSQKSIEDSRMDVQKSKTK